ncbi:hypothetical protein Glove_82g82 [Diversispora epigaea]|uniref:Uncharacterized protein n=1 Tax=Diversispora epigaea TaxID=1348612 RepID=A0A397JEM6_9GLOM|nr:hypothetical protein Glove_82g82 [Diversispora epigaea]
MSLYTGSANTSFSSFSSFSSPRPSTGPYEAGRGTRNTVPLVATFEFGTQDGTGTATNINQGQCTINISLSCLYHELKPLTQIPQNLPDPIPLDFYFVQRAITRTFNIH